MTVCVTGPVWIRGWAACVSVPPQDVRGKALVTEALSSARHREAPALPPQASPRPFAAAPAPLPLCQGPQPSGAGRRGGKSQPSSPGLLTWDSPPPGPREAGWASGRCSHWPQRKWQWPTLVVSGEGSQSHPGTEPDPGVSDVEGLQGRCSLPALLPWSLGSHGLGKGQGRAHRV